MGTDTAGFKIVEHTADVGFRAWAPSQEELFRQATLALLDINGARAASSGETRPVEVTGDDLGAVLVAWLDEVLYLQDSNDAVVGEIRLETVEDTWATGAIGLEPSPGAIEGTAVKAITYHQLRVERTDGRWEATVFVDI